MNCRTPGFPVLHHLLELAQTHVHWAGDAIQPLHSLASPSLLPSIFPSIRIFSNELAFCIRWPNYWSFSFSISPSSEYSGLISFWRNWLDLLAVQGTLKRLLQHHSSKASVLQCLLLGRKTMTNLDSIWKSRDITLLTKVHLAKAMVFPVVMYGCELDYKESWAPKNWRFWTVELEKTLESPLDCKEIQPDHPKGNQSWIFTGRTDAEAETPILGPPDAKSWLIGKDSDAVQDWRQEEKGTVGDEMVGWHPQLNGHESE